MALILSLLILVPLLMMSTLAAIEMLFENTSNPIHRIRWLLAGVVGAVAAGYIIVPHVERSFLFDSKIVAVEYREDKVDISRDNFEAFVPSSKGKDFNGAWYDEEERYMIIRLGDRYYHYCAMPRDAWSGLKEGYVPEYGRSLTYMHYERYIKGNYDCRKNHIPSYQ